MKLKQWIQIFPILSGIMWGSAGIFVRKLSELGLNSVCQVVNDVKTKNIVYMKMQSIIILCIFIIIHLLFSILSCSF